MVLAGCHLQTLSPAGHGDSSQIPGLSDRTGRPFQFHSLSQFAYYHFLLALTLRCVQICKVEKIWWKLQTLQIFNHQRVRANEEGELQNSDWLPILMVTVTFIAFGQHKKKNSMKLLSSLEMTGM